jgi:hypothetical protein
VSHIFIEARLPSALVRALVKLANFDIEQSA